MNFIAAITSLLTVIIQLLRSQKVDDSIIDAMNTLVVALENSDDLASDLEELTAKVREMAELSREPTADEFQALQDRAKSAMASIEASADMRARRTLME